MLLELQRMSLDHHAVGDRRRTGGNEPADIPDADEAGSAGAGWLQAVVMAKRRYVDRVSPKRVQYRRAGFALVLLAVDDYITGARELRLPGACLRPGEPRACTWSNYHTAASAGAIGGVVSGKPSGLTNHRRISLRARRRYSKFAANHAHRTG